MTATTVPDPEFTELRPPLGRTEAVLEADRCLECGGPHAPAPCAVACPAGVDVPRFIAEIAEGDPGAAAATIFAENMLGGTCARVCPVEVLCEGACVLDHEQRPPIAIGALQRYATDRFFEQGLPLRTRAPANGRRVAVIGAGPSGLACAGELAARGYDVTVYDEREEIGGLVRYAIAPYRQVREPLPEEARALARLGVELRLGTQIEPRGLERALEDAKTRLPRRRARRGHRRLLARRRARRRLGVARLHRGAQDGGPPEVGRQRRRVGGGNTAIDVAREALRLGAEESRSSTAAQRRRCLPTPTRSPRRARRASASSSWRRRSGSSAEPARGDGVPPMGLGEPDESGRRRPVPVAGPSSRSRRHGREGDRPAAAHRARRLDRRARAGSAAGRGRPSRPDGESEVLRRRRRRQRRRECRRGGARWQASREGDRRVAAMHDLTEIRWHARAGQGAKTASQILALRCCARGSASRPSPNTARSAAARRFARTPALRRPADQPPRRDRAPRRRRRARASLVREAHVTEGLAAGWVVLNAERRRRSSRARVSASRPPARRRARLRLRQHRHARRRRGRARRAAARATSRKPPSSYWARRPAERARGGRGGVRCLR